MEKNKNQSSELLLDSIHLTSRGCKRYILGRNSWAVWWVVSVTVTCLSAVTVLKSAVQFLSLLKIMVGICCEASVGV